VSHVDGSPAVDSVSTVTLPVPTEIARTVKCAVAVYPGRECR
jgi:hypothetical protein